MNTELLTSIFVSVLGSGILATIITAFVTRRKIAGETKNLNVDASQKQVQTSLDLVDSYRKAYEEVCSKLEKIEKEMEELSSKFNGKIQELSDENIALRKDMKDLSNENVSLKSENDEMKLRVQILEEQVVSLGGKPLTNSKKK